MQTENAVFNSDPNACHDVIFQNINSKFYEIMQHLPVNFKLKQFAELNTRNTTKKIDPKFQFISHVSLCGMREKSSALKYDRSFHYGGSVWYVRERMHRRAAYSNDVTIARRREVRQQNRANCRSCRTNQIIRPLN